MTHLMPFKFHHAEQCLHNGKNDFNHRSNPWSSASSLHASSYFGSCQQRNGCHKQLSATVAAADGSPEPLLHAGGMVSQSKLPPIIIVLGFVGRIKRSHRSPSETVPRYINPWWFDWKGVDAIHSAADGWIVGLRGGTASHKSRKPEGHKLKKTYAVY